MSIANQEMIRDNNRRLVQMCIRDRVTSGSKHFLCMFLNINSRNERKGPCCHFIR